MKNKVICILVVVGALFVSFMFTSLDQKALFARVHQHRMITSAQPMDDEATRLPIVSIDTQGKKIPGEAVLDDLGVVQNYTTNELGEKMAEMNVSIYDDVSMINRINNKPTQVTKSLVRYRGHSSRLFSKKGYLLRFVQDDGKDHDLDVMGMGKESEWVLHGPFLDKTLMRNYLCMNVIGQVMPFTPDVRFCRLYVDGNYQGLYLMESIRRGEQRVNIKKNSDDDLYISYIIRMDSDSKNQKALDTFGYYTFMTQDTNTRFGVVYPGTKNLKDEWKTYIEDDISRFEKALYSYDFMDQQNGYRAYIDVDSFVDMYVFMEFFGISDFGRRSTYLYKDGKGKLTMGPVWDFNNAMDNFFLKQPTDTMQFHDLYWYRMLLKDEDFVNKVIHRYEQLRKNVLDEAYLYSYIDEVCAFLGTEIDKNFEVWGYSFDASLLPKTEKLSPDERNVKSWEEAVVQMKTYIHERGTWLDEHIDTLYQYCHDSKNKDSLLK